MLAIIGIIYGAYCAWAQRDLKKLVAYSSVSHLGVVMLGIFGLTSQGLSGALLQMVNHGISTGALFLLVGVIYERSHTRELSQLGGLASVMPHTAAVFVVIALSSMGLPATNGFVGEFMILAGTFMSDYFGTFGPLYCVCAATGVILAAIYLLHAILKIFFGPVSEKNSKLSDLTGREALVLLPLVILVFWIGLFPEPFLKPTEPSVNALARNYLAKLEVGASHPEQSQLLPEAVAKFPAAPEVVSEEPLAVSDRVTSTGTDYRGAAEVAP
jgi:NADH-quinone oxidoreductase subunit M